MKTKVIRTWSAFKSQIVQKYLAQPAEHRRLFWFRGQPCSSWRLVPTLDRFSSPFASDEARSRYAEDLLSEFREQTLGLGARDIPPYGKSLELLARHHGLPSPILDWTESPYIAAFFAFQEERDSSDDTVAIWAFNSGRLEPTDFVDLIREPEELWYNPRAQQQRSVFMRVNGVAKGIEERLGSAIEKIELPVDQHQAVLRDLEAMNITPRVMFPDLDGAARTVTARRRFG